MELDIIRRTAMAIEDVTGRRADIRLACAGYADEHWQFFLQPYDEFPCLCVVDGKLDAHPSFPSSELACLVSFYPAEKDWAGLGFQHGMLSWTDPAGTPHRVIWKA